MKRITEIEFVNYKAFFDRGEDNKIVIPEGKSVLLYGENGSGKSSIYEGLKQFFNSTDNTINVAPSRHIKVPATRIENPGTDEETEVPNEVAVKITFSDSAGNETRIFGVPTSDTQGVGYLSSANLLNSFLSYKELLRTYLVERPNDRQEFRQKFAFLLIEVILSKQVNTVTQRTFQQTWDDLHRPYKGKKRVDIIPFNQGLRQEIQRINLLLPALLTYFEEDFQVKLVLTKSEIDYDHSTRMNRMGNYPFCEIDLEVFLFGENVENDEENHLTVLNEARLSALAISIYLASLINTPQQNFDFKILFLDDIFIGLDMSNRLPLLEILKGFKKPIIVQEVDTDGNIVEKVSEVDGVIQTAPDLFFKSYQIFISTYDRFWFTVARNFLETKSKDRWCFLELYANRKDGLTFDTPLLYTSLDYLQKAEFFYAKHDYPSCANNLRKALEKRLKELLPPNRQYAELVDSETGITEIKKLRTLNQYLEKFIAFCAENGVDASELTDLKNLKDWYFNPFSHDNIGTPIFKRELDLAKSFVYKLEDFQFNILLEAGHKLSFVFDDGKGKTWSFNVELQENLRWIKSVEANLLVKANIRCYEKTIDGTTSKVDYLKNGDTLWTLRTFFLNKWHSFNESNEEVTVERLWNEVKLLDNGDPLISLIPQP